MKHIATEDDVPGDVLSSPDGPHRAGGRGQHRRHEYVLSGAGRESCTEGKLHVECEDADEGGGRKLGEHGCRRRGRCFRSGGRRLWMRLITSGRV